MKRKITISVVLVTLLITTIFLVSCGSKSKTMKDYKDRTYIKVGYDEAFYPMGFKKDGKASGFDVELARLVSKEIGIEFKFISISWDRKDIELKSGNIDLIWNGFTITEERKNNILFTIPYLSNEQVFVVKKENVDKFKKIDEIKKSKVIFQSASPVENTLTKLGIDNKLGINDNVSMLTEISSGRSEVMITDKIFADYYIHEKGYSDKLSIIEVDDIVGVDHKSLKSSIYEEYGIGMRKDNVELKAALDKALKNVYKSGSIKNIAEKYSIDYGDIIIR